MKTLCLVFAVLFFSWSVFLTTKFEATAGEINQTLSIHQLETEKYQGYQPTTEFENQSASGGEITPLAQQSAVTINRDVFGFHPYWMTNSYENYRYDLLSHVAYFGAKIETNGDITDTHEWPHYGLVNKAHQNGVKVVLVARNFTSSEVSALLSNSTARSRAINNLVTEVQKGGGDGVNIDFEYVLEPQRDNFVTFMTDLANTFHTQIPGSHVSIDMPAVDWWNSYDYARLGAAVDALMIMGYDYHYAGSSQAGPVAPLATDGKWSNSSYNVTNTIETYLEDVDPGKILLGVPYYGYDWEVSSNSVPANTTSRGSAKTYAEAAGEAATRGRQWDSDSYTPFYQYGNYHQAWYDDTESLGSKYDLVNNQNLAGIGIWALGYDGSRTELWEKMEEKFEARTDESVNNYLSVVTGAGRGGGPHVRAFNLEGEAQANPNKLFPYPEDFHGGINVATGDIDGDGEDEIITAPKAGGGPQVRVFEGDGTPRGIEIWPFHPNSRTGINVATGDTDGDGKDEITVSQEQDGHAWVKVYRYNNEKTVLGEWNAYDDAECGASVAMGDIDYDGQAEVIVGAGPGGGPHIRVYEADGTRKAIQFFAFHPNYHGGIDVAAGDIDNDGKADIGVCQQTEQAWCKVYRYNMEHTLYAEWKAYGEFTVGARLDMADIDGDSRAEVVTGAGATGGPQVRAFEYDGTAFTRTNFFAYDTKFRGGVDVAVGYWE
ncbi:VCBS repeat-containing protein [Patescibacteria group bacterium]|nr:VCBS repeat-containing protein [Patescibacteria group bacterium]